MLQQTLELLIDVESSWRTLQKSVDIFRINAILRFCFVESRCNSYRFQCTYSDAKNIIRGQRIISSFLNTNSAGLIAQEVKTESKPWSNP